MCVHAVVCVHSHLDTLSRLSYISFLVLSENTWVIARVGNNLIDNMDNYSYRFLFNKIFLYNKSYILSSSGIANIELLAREM